MKFQFQNKFDFFTNMKFSSCEKVSSGALGMGSRKDSGFTLVEVLIAIFIFTTVIGIVTGVFVVNLNYQKRVLAMQDLENNARYLIETISRDIRMAKEIKATEEGINSSELTFTNYENQEVTYCESNSTGNCAPGGKYLSKNVTGLSDQVLTSSNILVDKIVFITNQGFTDNVGTSTQRLITVSVGVCIAKSGNTCDPNLQVKVQTSIAGRIY